MEKEEINEKITKDTENKFKWYALYCISNQEKATKLNLERELKYNNLENCVSKIEVPLDKVIVNIKGKKVTREKILLPCYIFINADISNGELLPVLRRTKGVLGFINPSDGKTRDRPEPLKNSEVDKFFKISKPEENEQGMQFIIGDMVRITEGAFASFEGVIDVIDSQKKMLKVIVKIFSRETSVEVNFNQVDKEIIKNNQ